MYLIEHSVFFVLDGVYESGEFFEGAGYDQLVICLVGPNALELEVAEGGRQSALGS